MIWYVRVEPTLPEAVSELDITGGGSKPEIDTAPMVPTLFEANVQVEATVPAPVVVLSAS